MVLGKDLGLALTRQRSRPVSPPIPLSVFSGLDQVKCRERLARGYHGHTLLVERLDRVPSTKNIGQGQSTTVSDPVTTCPSNFTGLSSYPAMERGPGSTAVLIAFLSKAASSPCDSHTRHAVSRLPSQHAALKVTLALCPSFPSFP